MSSNVLSDRACSNEKLFRDKIIQVLGHIVALFATEIEHLRCFYIVYKKVQAQTGHNEDNPQKLDTMETSLRNWRQ